MQAAKMKEIKTEMSPTLNTKKILGRMGSNIKRKQYYLANNTIILDPVSTYRKKHIQQS